MDKLKKYGKKKIFAFLMAVIAVTGIAAASAMAAEDPNGPYAVTETNWYKFAAAIITQSGESGVLNGNYSQMYYGAQSCAVKGTNFRFKVYCMYKKGGVLSSYNDKVSIEITQGQRVSTKRELETGDTSTEKWKLKLSSWDVGKRACYGNGWMADWKRYN